MNESTSQSQIKMKAYSFTGLLSCYVFVLLLFILKYPLNSSINNSSFYCGMDGSFDCFILGKYSLQNRRDFLRKQRRARSASGARGEER